MKTLKSIAPLSLFLLLAICPLLLQAQERPMGDGLVVIKKILNDPKQAYSSTIDLNDDRKQLIMAGQNYQTNYGIYAAIKMAPSSLGSNYRTLEQIEFEIVNYKPTYFIGLDSVVVSTTRALDGLTFKIYTKAMSNTTAITMNKAALKDIHFEEGSYLHSERYLNPMFPQKDANGQVQFMEDGEVVCMADNGLAFDFEFFYKDGDLVVRREPYDLLQLGTKTYLGEAPSGMPGKRCKQSFNKIVF